MLRGLVIAGTVLTGGDAVAREWPEFLPNSTPSTATRRRGKPADPINVALVGSAADLASALGRADWVPADRGTLLHHARSGAAYLFKRPYKTAPVSPLYLWGRRHDIAYERDVDRSVHRRHHVRFWKAAFTHTDGRPVWVGSATYDMKLKVTLMHRIAPDVDVERDRMFEKLEEAGAFTRRWMIAGWGEVKEARNGSNDWYFTDGRIAAAELVSAAIPVRPAPAPSRRRVRASAEKR